MDSEKLALKLAELALTKKAEEIRILDLRGLTTIADFFVICTANSEPQVKAVADEVLVGSKKIGEAIWHKEGLNMKSWVLLDYVDVVVHIFLRDTRQFYSLEKLWGDAKITEVSDEPVKPKAKPKVSEKPKSARKPKMAAKTKSVVKPKKAAKPGAKK
ncbi:MAG: ribosome silencing factor [Ignavibacteria bacterium]